MMLNMQHGTCSQNKFIQGVLVCSRTSMAVPHDEMGFRRTGDIATQDATNRSCRMVLIKNTES